MKYIYLLITAVLLYSCKQTPTVDTSVLQNGDLIFQTSTSAQSQAIQLATKSKYSHCGIVYKEGNDYFVFEAIQPVTKTPLNKWIARGKDAHYAIKRLKDAEKTLTKEVLQKMKAIGKTFTGKDYDLYFEWSNNRIYCSELIWKIYKEGAGIEIGHLQTLKEFDLSNPAVRQKLKERYGNNIPKNEKVISPAAMFNSNLLITVMEK
ncbi:YiiX family permuted papain-like enzyme [Flavobacterium subsaxonicum]|uniref:Peptidoglycan peptidase n=1 Tax=Flavobacterium subsaxonicum WB 4.1-42 = DSM 21790 TaxID=1121898 RepID=A0A0A2MM95_9FLAO|nr:YiiX family permuted papain-like enzyme [Flavobacterium subsaxonicum]KGO93762.1 peptidoglycan peptidase [Flavobacterium subsaxonicum WB 4.1-42 = DSM 21790]